MKIADCHMHSFFSSDSEAPTEEMVKRAVELGLPAICLTDHYDMDYSTGEFQLDTPAYAAKIRESILIIGVFSVNDMHGADHIVERPRIYILFHPFF